MRVRRVRRDGRDSKWGGGGRKGLGEGGVE